MLLHLLVYFLVDLGLQAGDLLLLAHQQQYFFHAPEQGYGIENILKFATRSAGHGCTEVRKGRAVIGPEA